MTSYYAFAVQTAVFAAREDDLRALFELPSEDRRSMHVVVTPLPASLLALDDTSRAGRALFRDMLSLRYSGLHGSSRDRLGVIVDGVRRISQEADAWSRYGMFCSRMASRREDPRLPPWRLLPVNTVPVEHSWGEQEVWIESRALLSLHSERPCQ